jgi:hypothetical protein
MNKWRMRNVQRAVSNWFATSRAFSERPIQDFFRNPQNREFWKEIRSAEAERTQMYVIPPYKSPKGFCRNRAFEHRLLTGLPQSRRLCGMFRRPKKLIMRSYERSLFLRHAFRYIATFCLHKKKSNVGYAEKLLQKSPPPFVPISGHKGAAIIRLLPKKPRGPGEYRAPPESKRACGEVYVSL